MRLQRRNSPMSMQATAFAVAAVVTLVDIAGSVGGSQLLPKMETVWPTNWSKAVHPAAMIAASAQPDPQLTFVGFGPVELAYPTFADEVDAVPRPLREKQWYADTVDVLDESTRTPLGLLRMPAKRGTIAVARSAALVGRGILECSSAWHELPARYTGLIENNIHNNNDKKNNGAREEGRYLIPLDKCTQSYYFGHFIDSCLHKLVPLWDFAHRDDVDIMLDCKYYQGKQQSWEMMLELGFPPHRLK
eukprot:gene23820-8806_t